jgi:NAD(P)-dependent dehydrogenase (short-subunit alcohol dehydrogenase family)
MPRLAHKVALVTGAASTPGLGSATARRFAEEGAIVIVTDIDLVGAQTVVASIHAAGGSAISLVHDVTSEADWDRVIAAVIAAYGRIDVLVNNAGIAILRAMDVINSADWLRQIDVNLNSVFYGTVRAVREMRRVGGGGSIINISSVGGMIGVPGCAAYTASKGAIRIFSKTVALETAREGIRVNSVHPGMIMTNISIGARQEQPEQFELVTAAIPMGRMGEPEDVANMNLFLASDEARYVTGAEFVVDGGFTAK